VRLSTAVALENLSYLESMVSNGCADSIAEAVDLAVTRLRRIENCTRLDAATAAYFDGLSPEAQSEERKLARLLHRSTRIVKARPRSGSGR